MDFTNDWDIDYLNDLCFKLKNNSVVTIRCKEDSGYQCLRARFDPKWPDNGFPKCCNILTSKFIIEREKIKDISESEVSCSVDHLNQFKEYILENIGSDDIVLSELQEICK